VTTLGAAGLQRLRIDIAYDGSPFAGWARQPGQRTVQGEVEDALMRVARLPAVRLTVAGRTDSGVHAARQVAHVDIPDEVPLGGLARRLNGVLDRTVRVLGIGPAPDGFDARFSALSRRYNYRISDAPYGADPLRRHDTVAWPRPLDPAAMRLAALALLGEHDFAAFCRRREGATTIRTLLRLEVTSRRTRSAIPWSAPWSAHWWPSARGASRRSGCRGCWRRRSATPVCTCCPRTDSR
jgi:tRNA pseudouridine38-40 synthase